jgi:hypothetical protein
MHGAGKMIGSLQSAFDKSLVDNHFGRHVRQFTSLPSFRMGSKFRCIRSTPTEIQSMSENDFERFASTGVKSPASAMLER